VSGVQELLTLRRTSAVRCGAPNCEAVGLVGLPAWLKLDDRTLLAARLEAANKHPFRDGQAAVSWCSVSNPVARADSHCCQHQGYSKSSTAHCIKHSTLRRPHLLPAARPAAPAAQPDSLRDTARCRLPAEPKPDGSAAIGALAADCSAADGGLAASGGVAAAGGKAR